MHPSLSERLQSLNDILAGSRNALTGPRRNLPPGEQQLLAVPFERIRQLTAFLEKGRSHTRDDVDTLSAHLLLNDVIVAVAHLRAVTEITASRIEIAGGSLKPVRNFLHRQAKIKDKSIERIVDIQVGISIGIGMGALHSAPLGALIWVAVAGGFFTLARTIFGKLSEKREKQLADLTDRLESLVESAAQAPAPQVGASAPPSISAGVGGITGTA